jgi:hypothetical protein
MQMVYPHALCHWVYCGPNARWVVTWTVSSAIRMPTFHNHAIFLVVAIKCRSFETMLEAFLSSVYLTTMGSSGEVRLKIVLEAFLSSLP